MKTEYEIREHAAAMESVLHTLVPMSEDFLLLTNRLSTLHWILDEYPSLETQEATEDLMQELLIRGATQDGGRDEPQE
jgi:hypothetical protein